MKVGFTLKKELKEPILKEIRDGGFTGANEFINHVIEQYFKNKDKGEALPDIDDFFNIESEKNLSAVENSKGFKSYKFINELKENDSKAPRIKENSPTTYYYNQGSSGRLGHSKDDFQFNLYSTELGKLNTLDSDTQYQYQELHNPDSMLFGQINRHLAIKSALYITAVAIKENGYKPISFDTTLITDIAIVYALNIYELSLSTRKIFGANISISLPKVGSIFEYNRGANNNGPDMHSVQKSVNRFIMQYFWNIRRMDKKVDGVLAKLGFIKMVKTENDFKIHLTSEGIEFLKLKNSVFNCLENSLNKALGYEKSLQPLSNDEIKFIINHIKKVNSNEYVAMKMILHLIKDGKNNPSRIEANVSDKIFGDKKALVDMNRNGTIARLGELRLISTSRERQSQVEYSLTDSGLKFINKEGVI